MLCYFLYQLHAHVFAHIIYNVTIFHTNIYIASTCPISTNCSLFSFNSYYMVLSFFSHLANHMQSICAGVYTWGNRSNCTIPQSVNSFIPSSFETPYFPTTFWSPSRVSLYFNKLTISVYILFRNYLVTFTSHPSWLQTDITSFIFICLISLTLIQILSNYYHHYTLLHCKISKLLKYRSSKWNPASLNISRIMLQFPWSVARYYNSNKVYSHIRSVD